VSDTTIAAPSAIDLVPSTLAAIVAVLERFAVEVPQGVYDALELHRTAPTWQNTPAVDVPAMVAEATTLADLEAIYLEVARLAARRDAIKSAGPTVARLLAVRCAGAQVHAARWVDDLASHWTKAAKAFGEAVTLLPANLTAEAVVGLDAHQFRAFDQARTAKVTLDALDGLRDNLDRLGAGPLTRHASAAWWSRYVDPSAAGLDRDTLTTPDRNGSPLAPWSEVLSHTGHLGWNTLERQRELVAAFTAPTDAERKAAEAKAERKAKTTSRRTTLGRPPVPATDTVDPRTLTPT
jgi:hypothetical protein